MAMNQTQTQDNKEYDTEDRDVKIIPGLIGLNLNIMHALDMHMIEDAKQNIFKLTKKEHVIVKNVHQNLIAVLKMKIPRERREARIELEQLIEEYPEHLNALADLEHIYKEISRISDAKRCRKTIDSILVSKSKANLLHKKTCLLEQGYAILVERTLINESTIQLRISDLHKMLNTEHERSEGNRKECLERGLHFQMQVLLNVQNASEDDRSDGHVLRKGSSLQKFAMAEKLNNEIFPHVVWNFYYAKALNQYYDSLEFSSKRVDDTKEERIMITLQAIEKFWNISIYEGNEDIELFKARSFAYIGHILMKRGDLVLSAKDYFVLFKNDEFNDYIEHPLYWSKKAFDMEPNDITVLTRYGRAIWNKTVKVSNTLENINNLEHSEQLLSKSIDIDNTRNWFALSSRMVVRHNLSDMYIQSDKEKSLEYLHKAETDGHVCFTTRTTRKDMTILAEVCQKLAKFPNIKEIGPRAVNNKQYLHKALDYLFYATYLGDPPGYHWPYRIASCLFDLGEYDQAIEWLRKAWFLNSDKSSYAFYMLCLFILTKFDEENIMGKSDEKPFREFLYILIYAKKKYKDITRNLCGIYSKKRREMYECLYEILITKALPLRQDEKNIIENCLNILLERGKHDRVFTKKLKTLECKLKLVIPEKETEYVLSEIVSKTSLKALSECQKACSKDYKYDFFVCHSHKDSDWVTNILLRHLEGKFDDQDVAFKGCIADRDFTPGISVLDNIIGAVKESSKVLLILTDRFVSSNWCNYEADQAVIRSLKSKEHNNCVIPVLLEDCEIPDKIQHLNYTDLTNNQDYVNEMRRLKKALLPCEK